MRRTSAFLVLSVLCLARAAASAEPLPDGCFAIAAPGRLLSSQAGVDTVCVSRLPQSVRVGGRLLEYRVLVGNRAKLREGNSACIARAELSKESATRPGVRFLFAFLSGNDPFSAPELSQSQKSCPFAAWEGPDLTLELGHNQTVLRIPHERFQGRDQEDIEIPLTRLQN